MSIYENGSNGGKEAILPGPALDKLSGLQYLAGRGIPVPEIFSTEEEAQQYIDRGGQVIIRTYVAGQADQYIIGCLPSQFIGQGDGVRRETRAIINKAGFILASDKFVSFARFFGQNPADLQIGYFFQAYAGDIKVITMDGPNGHFVSIRPPSSGSYFYSVTEGWLKTWDVFSYVSGYTEYAKWISRLHQESVSHLDSSLWYQLEMAAPIGSDGKVKIESTRVVQVRPVVKKGRGTIVETNRHDLKNFIKDGFAGPSLYVGEEIDGEDDYILVSSDPYIKIISYIGDTLINPNIKCLILNTGIARFLQHGQYALVKRTLMNDGSVILVSG